MMRRLLTVAAALAFCACASTANARPNDPPKPSAERYGHYRGYDEGYARPRYQRRTASRYRPSLWYVAARFSLRWLSASVGD